MKSTVIVAYIFAIILALGSLQTGLYAQTTYESAQSGDFSVGSTWVGGQAPPDYESILIKSGHIVTLDRGTGWNDYILVWNVTIEAGAVLNNNGWPLWIRTPETSTPQYKNDGIHNGPGTIQAYQNGNGRIDGNGSTNLDIEYDQQGRLQVRWSSNLTINGNIKPTQYGFAAPTASQPRINYEVFEGVGGTLTVNGDVYSAGPIINRPGTIVIPEEGTLIVNGNIYFNANSDQITNNGTFTVTGDITLGTNTGSYFWNRNQGYAEIEGDVLGGGSCFLRHGNDAHIKLGGQVFPDGFEGTLQFILPSNLNIVEYNGTSAQVVKPFGTIAYSNLIINNTSADGLTLSADISVNNILTLANGNVLLADKNLTLDTSATITGTPSANNMIVANSSGEVRKIFTNPGSFTFPIGDNTGTAEFSPVTMDFSSGTFTDGYAGVNLVNAAYPGFTGSYLNRYWNINSSGITDFTCNAQFDYVPADVTGIESNLYCYRVAPTVDQYNVANTSLHQLTANGLTSFGTFTGRQQDNPDFPIAFSITGGGVYCSGDDGLPVGLSGSEADVTYTLFKDDIAQIPEIIGTGSAIEFGNQLFGIYTVSGTNLNGTSMMIGDAVIIENQGLMPVAIIEPDANSICTGSEVIFYSSTTNPGDTPVYQWFVNDIETGNNSPEFSYYPENGDNVYLVLTSSELCTTENPVQSNTVNLSTYPLPEVSWQMIGLDTLCVSWPSVVLTGGLPEGGSYSGNGVTNNTFNPAIAGPGTHDIIYTFTDGNNCSGQAVYSIFVEVCTSVNNPGSDSFSLFPNPASERFTIKTSGQLIEEIALFNSLGNLIIERKGLNKANAVSVTVDGFPAGVYFVRIKCLEGFFVKLVTIQ